MDDVVFFDTILPTAGLRCIAVVRPNGKWLHYWGPDNAWLVKTALRLDAKGETVYFGCASFLPIATARKADGGGRRQENVAFIRAFFVDLDVGPPEPGKRPKYPTQRAAAEAILAFARKRSLPTPWLVNSGWGVHVYWPVVADMRVSDWKPVAEALKRALTADGVLYDPSRTADASSVLRPPGTHNRKRQPKPVKLVVHGGLGTFAGMAAEFPPVAPMAAIATAKLSTQNAALGGGMGYEPSSALLIADRCAVIGKVRDTRGDVEQPVWYHSLGVLLHTDEAPAICHDWSNGHAEYSATETDAKLAQLGEHGPTTCKTLSDYEGDLCRACPHWGKIKSPIQLGRAQKVDPGQAEAEAQTDTGGSGGGAFGGGTTAAAPAQDPGMPEGYGFRLERGHKVLTYYVPAKGEEPGYWDVFCETFFRPLFNYEMDGVHYNDWLADSLDGTQRTFTLEGATIGKGGRDVASELGKNGIMIVPGRGRAMDGYLNRWMNHLTRTTPLVRAYKSFGWNDTAFVTGDVVVDPSGETPAILAHPAKPRKDAVTCKGDLATWVSLVDRAYNAPGQEAFQFQLAAGFAAPLLSLMDQVRGVTVFAHSTGSGVGKSTVQKVALSAWGNWDDMMLSQNKVTHNALWGFLGAYNTLPLVYDELTNAKPDDISDLVFSVSSGRAKERMTSAGELRSNNTNWSTILLANGNTLLSDKLAAHRTDASAEISRLFEFTLEASPHLSVIEANDLFPQFGQHYGHAGLKYARYLVANREKVAALLQRMQKRVITKFAIEQVDRHWSALFAATLVALHLCRGLKLLAFEVEAVEAWMEARLGENREQKVALVQTEEDQLGQMLGDMWPNVLVTLGMGSLRRGGGAPAEAVMDKPLVREALVGRRIHGQGTDPNLMYISRPAIRDWCVKKGANYRELHQQAVGLGWADAHDAHLFDLGLGTIAYSSNTYTRCWQFFPDRMPGGTLPGSNVVPINTGLTGGMARGRKP